MEIERLTPVVGFIYDDMGNRQHSIMYGRYYKKDNPIHHIIISEMGNECLVDDVKELTEEQYMKHMRNVENMRIMKENKDLNIIYWIK